MQIPYQQKINNIVDIQPWKKQALLLGSTTRVNDTGIYYFFAMGLAK